MHLLPLHVPYEERKKSPTVESERPMQFPFICTFVATAYITSSAPSLCVSY